MPDVSVIVPAFNAEKTIERCLNSLLAQAADIEVIVIDDCSTDATLAMCERYARTAPNVRVIHNEKNVGQGLSRNFGIEVATGDYLAFVDADDYVAPFMYEDLLALARPAGGEQVDIVGCDVCSPAPSVPGGFGRIRRLASVQTYDAEAIRREVLPEHLGAPPDKAPWPRAFPGSACAYLFSARLVREGEVRFLSERQVYSEDLFFDYAALSRARSFAFTATAYYFYVNRPGSTVHRYHDPRANCSPSSPATIPSSCSERGTASSTARGLPESSCARTRPSPGPRRPERLRPSARSPSSRSRSRTTRCARSTCPLGSTLRSPSAA